MKCGLRGTMSKDYQHAFLSQYQIIDLELESVNDFQITKSGIEDFQVDYTVVMTMYQSNFNRLIKDFSQLDRERARRERSPAAVAAYERYRQLLDLVPDYESS